MAAQPNPQGQPQQAKRTSFTGFPGGNASLFLEKSKAGMRGSTPDSEALASSDDEQDHYHRLQSINSTLGAKPARRSSWLTDVQPPAQRKSSLTGSGTFDHNNSHPTTPSSDSLGWGANPHPPTGSAIGRGHSNSASFPWSGTIWNSEPQKGPPLRLSEVLPSPTSQVPPAFSSAYCEEPLLSPPLGRENNADSAIPFAIPLHPTLKTYRSQSYSVGQLDPESMNPPPPNFGTQFISGRSRSGTSYAGLQHRHPRPSGLGEVSHDASLLGQLREVEDDDESSNGSEAGVQLSSTQARRIEQLAMENAMLRQAAADQAENSKGRSRANTSNPNPQIPRSATYGGHKSSQETVPDETKLAFFEPDDSIAKKVYDYENVSGIRSNEHVAKRGTQQTMSGITENRSLEGVMKKGQWQSSLGFGGLGDIPQSRRHSFADVPTRPTSISSVDEPYKGITTGDSTSGAGGAFAGSTGFGEGMKRPPQGDTGEHGQFRLPQMFQEEALELEHLRDRNFAASYFSVIDPSLRGGEAQLSAPPPASLHQTYKMQTPYGRAQPLGHPQPGLTQLLHVVTFKACRADVFYSQEGTGLQVKPGDLVIVEADRGTDLGTVAQDNVTWAKAKELKEHFIEEHYRWLMIFSRHGQNGSTSVINAGRQAPTSNSTQSSAVGGTGSTNGQSGAQDPQNVELKPKMIKRLAQAHEIQVLRDKEGNEAKAKRVCQQKVAEHRLNMEILDAEFQMDWKKLTFYYFADAYINFNPLVTDLFKIYKTRIWMSAINPASFLTPFAGLQLSSGVGPGTFNPDADRFLDRRHQKGNSAFVPTGPISSFHAGPTGFSDIWDPNQEISTPGAISFPQAYSQHFQSQDLDIGHLEVYPLEYRQLGHQAGGLQPRFPGAPYDISNAQNSSYQISHNAGSGAARKSHGLGQDFSNTFQRLSLGS